MKVLHFNLQGSFRGGQRQALLLHQGLLAQGIESHFLARDTGKLLEIAVRDRVVNMHPLALRKRTPRALRPLLSLRRVRDELRRIEPDILHFHEPLSIVYGILLPEYPSCETRRISSPIKKLSARIKYRKIDAHVGVSDYVTAHLRGRGLVNVHTIPSSIQIDRFHAVPPKHLRPEEGRHFLFVGAMAEMKGVDLLLEGFARLCRERDDVTLHLVGTGPRIEEYRRLSEALGIGEKTLFYGFVDDVEKYYPASDLVIVPSRRGEGSNGVVKEALVSGKPVLVSDYPPNLELVTEGYNGMVFENGNACDLCARMRHFLEGGFRLDSQVARDSVMRFSSDNMVGAYIRLYESMLVRSA